MQQVFQFVLLAINYLIEWPAPPLLHRIHGEDEMQKSQLQK